MHSEEQLKNMSLEQVVEILRKSRSVRERADALFLCLMHRVEQVHGERMREWGYDSFERFIEANKLVNAARYRDFVAGLRRLAGGETEAIERGAEATIIAAKISSDESVASFSNSVGDWVAEHGGVHPTRRTAEELARKIDPQVQVPASTKRATENAELKRRVAQLENENKRLKAKVRKLEAQLAERESVAAE